MPILRLCGGRRDSGLPSSRISPVVGFSNPASIISVVVLPEPEGPRRVKNSPRSMSRSSSSTTRAVPSYVLLTDAKRTIGSAIANDKNVESPERLLLAHLQRVVERLAEARQHLVDFRFVDDQGRTEGDDVARH